MELTTASVFSCTTRICQSVSNAMPEWLGRSVSNINGTLTQHFPELAESFSSEVSCFGLKTTFGTLTAYSLSVLAVAWPIINEVGSFVYSTVDDWAVSRKVSKLTRQLKNLKITDQKDALAKTEQMIKSLQERVVRHKENSVKSYLNPETIVTVGFSAVGLILTGAGAGIGIGLAAAAGITATSLMLRAVCHKSYKFREAGLAYQSQNYLQQIQDASEEANKAIQGQV